MSVKRRARAVVVPRENVASLDGEVWRPVVGYEGLYCVSNLGRVRTEPRMTTASYGKPHPVHQRILAAPLAPFGTGYPHVGLHKEGKQKTRLVHHLVLEAFVGPRPHGMDACHNDGNSKNACAANLRWDTHKANMEDAVAHGVIRRGSAVSASVLSERDVLSIRADKRKQSVIANEYRVTPSLISRIKSRDVWSHI